MTRTPPTPRMSARSEDGTLVSVFMLPKIAHDGLVGGRAILDCDEARALRDALTDALEIDDLRRDVDEAQGRLDERLAR